MKAAGTRSLIVNYGEKHGSVYLLFLFFLLFLLPEITTVGAQSGSPPMNDQYSYAKFSPAMAVIIVVLIAALFFMGFFSIYIRHCSDASGSTSGLARALSLRARRAAAARGLDPSVIETFPTFSYSEVKDHKIGKGTLECAVCLNEFQEDETLRLLPKCDHVFHPECIDAWLESHVTCPVCRANLAPEAGEEGPVQVPESTNDSEEIDGDLETSNSRNEEIAIQVVDDNQQQGQAGRSATRNQSSENPSWAPRSWSVRRPKMFGFAKFRSHSTGHSLVQPGQNLERFTLRLPAEVRKEVLDRAMSNRNRSSATSLPRERSSRRGYRTGEGEASSRATSYRRIDLSDRDVKSDRWVFFSRGLLMRSQRVGAETGEGSSLKRTGSRTPVKMPSFKCLEPKANAGDETGLVSNDSGQSPV